MSRDYASLVAQVIPVFALALGLEMRSVVDRFARRAAHSEAQGTPIRETAAGTVAWFSSLATIQLLLAGAEVRSLAVVADSSTFWNNITLPVAVVLVVTIPILGNVQTMITSTGGERVNRRIPIVVSVAAIAVVLVVLSYNTFG